MHGTLKTDLTADTDEHVDITPDVGILGVFGHLNYQPWFALAEFVDNALQSSFESGEELRRVESDYLLKVDIAYERENGGQIAIVDNAAGIRRSDFDRAFKAAEAPPDRSGLSEFGMGMKSASIWFARNWRVTTTSPGDPYAYSVVFDMDSVLSNRMDSLDVYKEPANPNDHYTKIELWNLNQFLNGRTLGKVRDHLREIYREFLRSNQIILTVGGQEMKYREPEILNAADFRTGGLHDNSNAVITWKKSVSFTLPGGVEVTGWAAIRSEGRTRDNGLVLFRRGRLVVGTTESPYRPARIFGQPNSYRSQRLFGELTIEGLSVSHTKDGFQWNDLEEEFEEQLRTLLDAEPLPLLKQAEGYRARRATRTENKRIHRATDNTADVTKTLLPETIETTTDSSDNPRPPVGKNLEESSLNYSRTLSFAHDGTTWEITIAADSRPAEQRWLLRQVDVIPGGQKIAVSLTLNTSHPFLSQFALGSADALEAVFRIAVALVISESLLIREGDGETTARFLRQVDALLSAALSKRLRSDI